MFKRDRTSTLYLKQQGFNIYATVKNRSDIDQLKSLGLNTYYLDVTDIKSIQDTINTIISKEKSLDVVFNNAGFGQPGAIEDISTKILKEQFETNLFGLHSVTLEALKVMKAQGYGKIIQHSSVLGLVSLKFRGAYNASKYAIEV